MADFGPRPREETSENVDSIVIIQLSDYVMNDVPDTKRP